MIWFAAVCLILLAGCGKAPDIPVIASGSEYSDLLAKAQTLSQGPLEKYEKGDELSDSDMANLKEALRIFKGLIAFNPEGFGPYFGAGKIHQILGERDEALVAMKEFVELAPADSGPEITQLVAEAYYTSGVIYESNGEFERAHECAHEAVRQYNQNPNYLAFLASAEQRMGKIDEARKLVSAALRIDPSQSRARQLQKLIGSGEKVSPQSP